MEEIVKLENEAEEVLDIFSLLDKAKNIVKERGYNSGGIYQVKSIYSNKFVELRRKIENLQK